MEFYGIGNDIVEISRIGRSIERYGQRFLDKLFSIKEQRYCKKFNDTATHFSGRFAAKEAIVKALGTGIQENISWLDIEVLNDDLGKPCVFLSDRIRERFQNIEIKLSISHCRSHATAVAISFSTEGPREHLR